MLEGFPDKPKGMHWETYDRLRHTHDIAEARSNMGFMQLATGARPILMNGVYTIPNGSPEQAI